MNTRKGAIGAVVLASPLLCTEARASYLGAMAFWVKRTYSNWPVLKGGYDPRFFGVPALTEEEREALFGPYESHRDAELAVQRIEQEHNEMLRRTVNVGTVQIPELQIRCEILTIDGGQSPETR